MKKQLIFLSHIHEESLLAKIIQEAVEIEFSGFVKVFVSSDGKTIPSGTNFLKHVEDGLSDCVAAIYLISPNSVKRNWVNFELGAVWIRNCVSVKNGGPQIPTIPMCHSGVKPATLPMPLTNLNSIEATNLKQLEEAFGSIQTAVGGSGPLRTDFFELTKKIKDLEIKYTLESNIILLFKLIVTDNSKLSNVISESKRLGKGGTLELDLVIIDNDTYQKLQSLSQNELKGKLIVATSGSGFSFGTPTRPGTISGPKTTIFIPTDIVIDFESVLLKEFS